MAKVACGIETAHSKPSRHSKEEQHLQFPNDGTLRALLQMHARDFQFGF
jgi:hypothetical protein